MKIGSEITGLKFKTAAKRVTWRDTSNYAASIEDSNEIYLNDLLPEENKAHPMFAPVLSWPLISNIYEYTDMPYPQEIFRRMVHAFEYIEYTRLITPGEEVTIDGEIIAVVQQKSGTLLACKFTVKDSAGDHIHSEWIGGMLRGVQCEDGGSGFETLPHLEKFNGDKVLKQHEIYIRPELPYIYDGCNNIVFGIHTSPRFAQQAGLPNILLQGTAALGMAVSHIINGQAEADPGKIKSLSAKFTNMIFPDSKITVQIKEMASEQEVSTVFFQVLNEAGKPAISDGVVVLKIEREVDLI